MNDAEQRGRNAIQITQGTLTKKLGFDWPFGDDPVLNLGWLMFLGCFGGCWSSLWSLSPTKCPPPDSCGKRTIRNKGKKHFWTLKHPALKWERKTKKLVTVVFSCRFVKKRRLKRSKRQKQTLQKFMWWCPSRYQHIGSSVKIIFGKWPGWANAETNTRMNPPG